MKKVDSLLADYAAYHRARGNVICHFIGIPLIIFGLLSMLQVFQVATTTGAEFLIVAVTLYYLYLDVKLAAWMLIFAILLNLLAYAVGDYRFGAAAFVIGWIFQGIGHIVYEKKSPAFLRNLVHLLIGPIFLVNEAFRIRRIVPQG